MLLTFHSFQNQVIQISDVIRKILGFMDKSLVLEILSFFSLIHGRILLHRIILISAFQCQVRKSTLFSLLSLKIYGNIYLAYLTLKIRSNRKQKTKLVINLCN